MELQHIPKTFWHSLSIAVLVVSSGLTYIAYRSSTVSIELANAKINLSSEVASSTIALNTALDEAKRTKIEVENKYQVLVKQYAALKKQVENIEKQAKTDTQLQLSLEEFKADCPGCADVAPLPLPFTVFDQNILKAEASLHKLEALNKQIQPMQ